MAFNKSFISLPSTSKLGASSSPLAGGGSRLSAAPKLTKSSFSFRPIGRSSVVDTISAAPPGQANMEAMAESLRETNAILVEIQKQLAMDFAYRIAREKGLLQQQKQQESRRKFSKREKSLEAFRGIASSIVSVGKAVAKPFGNIFDLIKNILGILTAGIAANAFITWIQDEENQKKIKKFFNILAENWKLILGILGAIAAGALIIKVLSFTAALKGLAAFLLNPYTLGAIALLAATVYGFTAKNLAENMAGMLGDGGDEERKTLIKSLQAMRDMNDEQLKNTGITVEPSGFREEMNKQIYFLKTGEQMKYGFLDKSSKERADTAEFKKGLDFSGFTEKRDFLGIPGVRDPFTFSDGSETIKGRQTGGPGYRGRTYMVGEAGPELITFPENGVVFNHTNTEKVYNMLSGGGGKGKVEIYDLRTVKPKTTSPAPPMQPPATSVPELNAVNDNSERTMYMSAYGIV